VFTSGRRQLSVYDRESKRKVDGEIAASIDRDIFEGFFRKARTAEAWRWRIPPMRIDGRLLAARDRDEHSDGEAATIRNALSFWTIAGEGHSGELRSRAAAISSAAGRPPVANLTSLLCHLARFGIDAFETEADQLRIPRRRVVWPSSRLTVTTLSPSSV
jgi:hypothetical protein